MRPSFLRAFGAFSLWIVAPFAVLLPLVALGALVAMDPLLIALFVIFPHQWFAKQSGFVFSNGIAALIALAQWLIVALLYAYSTRRLRTTVHRWLPPIVILVVSGLIAVVVEGMGITVQADWL